jgi:two-component system phosphate regulon sensor histidine kinase PhoR
MLSASHNIPLTRRLVGSYLMFVLAGLLTCLAAAIILAMRGELVDLSVIVLILPVIFIGGGAIALHRLVRVNARIEEQLHRVNASGDDLATALTTLPDSAPLTHGWNRVVQQVHNRIAEDALDSKLGNFVEAFNQQLWEAIVSSLPEGVVASNRCGNVIRANRSAVTFLGARAESELVGRDFVALLATRLPTAPALLWDELRQGNGTLIREAQLETNASSGVWRVTRTPLLGEPSSIGSNVWILRDITQQRLAEDARQQFVATATHELRTPLANIKAYAETLALNPNVPAQEQMNFYNVISSEATRLARFVDDLLNVSQMETGAINIVRSEIDIERLLGEITEHVAPQSKEKHLRFETKLPQKYPKMRADKDKLSAALVNLIGNAIKYTPEGGWVQLKVEADESRMRFIVEDNGIGIDANELPQLCQKFFRSRDERVRKINGSGLGLAFTQEVAKLHGGALFICSELNKGSQFALNLPLA